MLTVSEAYWILKRIDWEERHGQRITEIKKASEVGKSGHSSYAWFLCPACFEGRWVATHAIDRPEFTGFCQQCAHKYLRLGDKNPSWSGGRIYSGAGYVLVKARDHPKANSHGYYWEHILVWEKAHNQLLPQGWLVHHLNGIKDDNRLENLVAMPKRAHANLAEPYQKRIRELEATKAILIERLKKCLGVTT